MAKYGLYDKESLRISSDTKNKECFNKFEIDCNCPIAKRVARQVIDRANIGYEKYGTTLERKDIDLLGWIQHLQEELLDAANYLERLKEENENSPTGKKT